MVRPQVLHAALDHHMHKQLFGARRLPPIHIASRLVDVVAPPHHPAVVHAALAPPPPPLPPPPPPPGRGPGGARPPASGRALRPCVGAGPAACRATGASVPPNRHRLARTEWAGTTCLRLRVSSPSGPRAPASGPRSLRQGGCLLSSLSCRCSWVVG